jgi:hypothetical protein
MANYIAMLFYKAADGEAHQTMRLEGPDFNALVSDLDRHFKTGQFAYVAIQGPRGAVVYHQGSFDTRVPAEWRPRIGVPNMGNFGTWAVFGILGISAAVVGLAVLAARRSRR